MPDIVKRYSIKFKGLRNGVHSFNFLLVDSLFEYYGAPGISGGTIRVNAEMDKRDQMLILRVNYSGNVMVTCDRCLGELQLPVNFDTNLFVKFGEEEGKPDPDIIFLEPENYELELADYFAESVCLNLPYRKVHGDNQEGESFCDPVMLDKLSKHTTKPKTEIIDPRWDLLKRIKLK